jgi:hypothetical protein
MVRSQIGTLTPNPSFSHNLCFKYSNESYEHILNIYVSRAFQWYKVFFNPMNFDPWNCSLKICKSIKTPTPKVGAHLGVGRLIPSHFPTLPGKWIWFLGCTLCPHLSKTLLWLWTKAGVVTRAFWKIRVVPKILASIRRRRTKYPNKKM